jgi:hypothetical protein
MKLTDQISQRLLRTSIAAGMLLTAFSAAADAAVFTTETWRGHQVLRMTGRIDPGSAKRLVEAAERVAPLPHGLPVLLLDSPGGSVDEAMEISSFLQRHPFHTVVPDGALCASACASIVFIAGRNRTVEPFGLLGQHSCSVGGSPDQACNDEIAEHAFKNGVSHGSVAAFVTYVQPDEIMWFTREDADGWGLTRYPREAENGFEKSEPRVIRMLTGRFPEAQAAWRIDFFEDGYRAFLRPYTDHIREMQLNVFCRESTPGRLFLSMEINGASEVVSSASRGVRVATDRFAWADRSPLIRQMDDLVTEVIAEIPQERIIPFLRDADELEFRVDLRPPYEPMVAKTFLYTSRDALLFAANNCASGDLAAW